MGAHEISLKGWIPVGLRSQRVVESREIAGELLNLPRRFPAEATYGDTLGPRLPLLAPKVLLET